MQPEIEKFQVPTNQIRVFVRLIFYLRISFLSMPYLFPTSKGSKISVKSLIILSAIFIYSSCTKEQPGEVIPIIEWKELSKTEIRQGDLNQDSLWLTITFEDGDGDLGFGSKDNRQEIFAYDSRTNSLHASFKIPDLPPSNGISQRGTLRMLVFTTCCLFPGTIPPCTSPIQYPKDSFFLYLHILDREGHKSDTIHTPWIRLNCI